MGVKRLKYHTVEDLKEVMSRKNFKAGKKKQEKRRKKKRKRNKDEKRKLKGRR